MMTLIRRGVAKGVIGWLAAVGFTVAAHAADLADVLTAPALKDPLPDTLTWNGITLFGTVDVGYGYSSIGAPINPNNGFLNANVWSDPAGYKAISTLQASGIAFSSVGLKIDENIGNGWKVIGQLDTGFDPLSGQLDDLCKSIVQNNGKPGNQQNVWFDSSRCGQVINGQFFGGVSNPTYGTLTFGRQNPLALDTIGAYDPLTGNFSFLQLGSSWGGASGSSEANKWDNSVKYLYQTGPAHAGLMYSQGSQDSGLHGQGYGLDAGVTWNGFSFDATYTMAKDQLVGFGYDVNGCGVAGTPSCSTIAAAAANNSAWAIMGRYAYDFTSGAKGQPLNKLTFFAGFQDDTYTNPSDPVSVGDTTNGGYVIGEVFNTSYTYGHKQRQTAWIGAKYELGPWAFTAGYYYAYQPYYAVTATSVYCAGETASNCSGAIHTASATVVYTFSKHLDVYAGLTWSEVTGGQAFGFTTATAGYATVPYETSFLSGIVLKF
jgi:predicted porin